MMDLELRDLVKIYPFADAGKRILGRKRAMQILEQQKKMPYITNEGVLAVQKFSLTVEKGDFVVLLGPSGCGKSSLIRMIAGLEEVSAGEILMDGQIINDVKPEDRDMAMVFQNYSLYPHFNVYENMAFPLKNLHVPRDELDAAVRETAEILGLTPYLKRRPGELSGGQLQRVAIGRALVRRPRIFLMDEPLSNLDLPLRQKLRAELREIHAKLGVTFIYVTHDQQEAFVLGTKIVIMRNGMIEQVGTPQELYTRPESLYVASFIGTPRMNLLDGAELKQAGAGWQVTVLGETVTLPADRCGKLTAVDTGRRVTLGVRPVHLELTGNGEGIGAFVEYVEHLGSECVVHLKSGGTELTAVAAVNPHMPARYKTGDKLHVTFPARRVYLFDPETGERIA